MKIVNEKTPGYILLSLWVLFTIVTLIWIAFASLSTSRAIMQGKVFTFPEGIHPENFARAWGANNISVFFFNSALYSVVGTFFSILISAPAAYVLARYTFIGDKAIKSGFIMAMSLPSIMIVLPLFRGGCCNRRVFSHEDFLDNHVAFGTARYSYCRYF